MTTVIQLAPDFSRLTAQADGHVRPETANHVDQESVELHASSERVSQLAVGGLFRQTRLPQKNGVTSVRLPCEAQMARHESQHAERDILRLQDTERLANQVRVVGLPVLVENARVDAQTNAITMSLASSRRVDAFLDGRGADLAGTDHPLCVETPRDDDLWIGSAAQEARDIGALGQQHQAGIGQTSEEGNQSLRQQRDVVQGEAVEHLSHVESDPAGDAEYRLADFLEHPGVIDVDLDERQVVPIDVREVAVGAVVGTAVRDGHELQVWRTADAVAKVALKPSHKRGCLADHQNPLTRDDVVAPAVLRRSDKPLAIHDLDRGLRKESDDPLRLLAFLHLPPQEDCARLECLGCIHRDLRSEGTHRKALYPRTVKKSSESGRQPCTESLRER
jgi:hypothetical protein